MIWELSCIPFLLHSAENWINLSKKTLKILEDLQADFFRAIFQLPLSTPIPILYFDTKTPLMLNRIWKKKLFFLWHLENLAADSLAGEVLILQRNLGLPGLVRECQEIISILGLGPIKSYTKAQWKREVSRLLEEKDRSDILLKTRSYKKLDYHKLSEEEYEVKPYLQNLQTCILCTLYKSDNF